MPAPPVPTLHARGDHEYAHLARAERHASGEHRKNHEEHLALADAPPPDGDHEEHASTHQRVAGVHAGASAAHEALAALYDQGEKIDPRVRAEAEHAAGRRVMVTKNDKGEDIRDDVVERERHAWLLRTGARLERVRFDDGTTQEIPAVTGCECMTCEAQRERGQRAVAGKRALDIHVAGRRAGQHG